MRHRLVSLLLATCGTVAASAAPIDTQKLMLTGQGPADAVRWDFAIDGGMRAGEKTTIPVPSNWQQQGFGHYQYGYDRATRTNDHAVYSRKFDVPASWQGKTIRLVFDAVMTDTIVKVNDQIVGPLHQGGFNRFSFDVTKHLKIGGTNDIEVDVAESSANVDTDIAERAGDYWTFGGIYRPVWLEALPTEAIAHVAIDGQASGSISADVVLADPKTVTAVVGQVVDKDGKKVGEPFSTPIPAGGTGQVTIRGMVPTPRLWTAETPNLYHLDVTLMKGDEAIHHVRGRFGFRTFEVRAGDGLYLNGQKIILKGVDRHSFRADTGRALNAKDAYDDVKLIRGMNMNAVRMSHYSPEESFLEACDELGLYVLDELSGWQHAHDTEVGRKLVRELVDRDVNHPSILFWDNGNEGGFNRELDADYARFDPQHRKVLHPWDPHDGVDTKHYPKYDDFVRRLAGPTIVMPTEFQHGLFDGGAGSGMEDYWKAILASPRGAGGFVWVFADEGIARTDQNGRIDNAATLAPDGIVGARHDPKPSYFTIRDIWSPVQIAAPDLQRGFDGRLKVRSSYDFASLSELSFRWEWLRFAGPADRRIEPAVLASGEVTGPPIAPHSDGELALGKAARPAQADALRLIARRGDELVMNWVWPVADGGSVTKVAVGSIPRVERTGDGIRLVAGTSAATFDPASGLLKAIGRGGSSSAILGGPRLVFARPADKAPIWTPTVARSATLFASATPGMANVAEIDVGLTKEDGWSGFTLQVSPDGQIWKTVASVVRSPRENLLYAFPQQQVAAVRIQDLSALRGQPRVRSVRLGYQPKRFGAPVPASVSLTTGVDTDPSTGKPVAWLEAPGAGGLEKARWTLDGQGNLTLAYRYQLTGPILYQGIGFDAPEGAIVAAKALVRGPWPVWKNRLRGPELGVYEIARAGKAGTLSPAHAGYFADPRWVRLETTGAPIVIRTSSATPFLQLGATLNDHPNTSPAFPATAFGFMQAIPAIGNKFHDASETGPAGKPTLASGVYDGSITLSLQPR